MISEETLVAATIATEVSPVASGAFIDSMIPLALAAVAECILGRMLNGMFGGKTARAVVLSPKQFSAVNREEYWFKAVLGLWQPQHVEKARQVWRRIISMEEPLEPGRRILWYYSPISMVPKDSVPPWVDHYKDEVLRPGIDREYFRFYGLA